MLMDYARAIKAYGNDYGTKKAIEEKKLFRIDDGVYSTKLIVSEEAALCFRYPKAVLALSSAFYLHGLTDTTPDYYEMATSRDAAKNIRPQGSAGLFAEEDTQRWEDAVPKGRNNLCLRFGEMRHRLVPL